MGVDYKRVMQDSILRLSELVRQRRKLDNEIARMQKMARWAALQRVDRHVSEASNEGSRSNVLGLTEAISQVLRTYDTWLSPVLVRDLLESVGFDTGGYREPLPSIHVTLKRLVDRGEAIQSKLSSGGSAYRGISGHCEDGKALANPEAQAPVQ